MEEFLTKDELIDTGYSDTDIDEYEINTLD